MSLLILRSNYMLALIRLSKSKVNIYSLLRPNESYVKSKYLLEVLRDDPGPSLYS